VGVPHDSPRWHTRLDLVETRTKFRDPIGYFQSSGTGMTQCDKFRDRRCILLFINLICLPFHLNFCPKEGKILHSMYHHTPKN